MSELPADSNSAMVVELLAQNDALRGDKAELEIRLAASDARANIAESRLEDLANDRDHYHRLYSALVAQLASTRALLDDALKGHVSPPTSVYVKGLDEAPAGLLASIQAGAAELCEDAAAHSGR